MSTAATYISPIRAASAASPEEQVSSTSWEMSAKLFALTVASVLNEPVCKVREYFYTLYTLDAPCETTAQKAWQVFVLVIGIIVCALLTPLTAPFGAAIRGLVGLCESKPFIFLHEGKKGKTLPPDKKITLASFNVCYMPAGYSITDGGVTPPSDPTRMQSHLRTLKELNPDLICLYEVADIRDAAALTSQLTDYPFIIPVAGVRTIGPTSMMYVASKYEIVEESIKFIPFEKETELTGRAAYSEKGFLSFDLRNPGDNGSFATIISTHLQHSEIPDRPEPDEQAARQLQMVKIAREIDMKKHRGGNVIFTGDLNQDESELESWLKAYAINFLKRDPQVKGHPTWGGDAWCAQLMNKPASLPRTLDYTLIAGKATAISTRIISSNFSGSSYQVAASSDHDLLFSTITLG